jgi:hypothetical protein
VSLVQVDAASSDAADIRITVGNTSACGTAADGILGCTTVSGDVTLLAGWDWYAGSSATAVGADQYDFQTIVTHELGHAVGVEHSADTQSVMYTNLTRGVARRDFAAQDLSLLEQEGGEDDHSSLTAALRADPSGGRGTVGGGHSCPICGQVHGDAHGPASVDASQILSAVRADTLAELGSGVVLSSELSASDRGTGRLYDQVPGAGFLVGGSASGRAVLVAGNGDYMVLGDTGRDLLVGGYARGSMGDARDGWSAIVDRDSKSLASAHEIVDDWLALRRGGEAELLDWRHRLSDVVGAPATASELSARALPDQVVDMVTERPVHDLMLFGDLYGREADRAIEMDQGDAGDLPRG